MLPLQDNANQKGNDKTTDLGVFYKQYEFMIPSFEWFNYLHFGICEQYS